MIFLTNSCKKKLRSCQNWILSFLGNFRVKVFCKTHKLLFFWTTSGKVLAGCAKQVSVAFRLLSTSPWELFEEFFVERFLLFLWTFFQTISGNWAGKVWPACQNCILRIYKIILKKKLFWKTIQFFHLFQTLGRKISASFRIFRRGCWSCILRIQINI